MCDQWLPHACMMNACDERAPVVPFESRAECEEMIEHLIQSYQCVVRALVTPRSVLCCCARHEGLGLSTQSRLQEEGACLFLKLTKGHGSDWCSDMSRVVTRVVTSTVQTMVRTCSLMDRPWCPVEEKDCSILRSLLREETRRVLCDENSRSDLMHGFIARNFQLVPGLDEDDYWELTPVSLVRAKQVAFAMLLHPRLGADTHGKILYAETVQLILAHAFT